VWPYKLCYNCIDSSAKTVYGMGLNSLFNLGSVTIVIY